MFKPNSKRSSARRHRSRGQSLVEFALVLPVFLILLAGMIDFGIGLYSYMTIINAARDGARLGANACSAVSGCSSAINLRVSAASGGLSPAVSVTCRTPANAYVSCAPASSGDSVTVTASYTYHTMWPLAFGTDIPMTATAKFMVQ